MNLSETLREAGLTDSETKVYETLLRRGAATRGSIVSGSGIAGSKVYEVLERLEHKGLVSTFRANNVKHFQAADPSQVLTFLDARASELARVRAEAAAAIPSLRGIMGGATSTDEVELFTGLHGLEQVFRDQLAILKKGDECLVMGGTSGTNERPVQAFFERVHLERETKRIATRMLFNERQQQETLKLYGPKKYPATTIRFSSSNAPVATNIFADRTVIIVFGAKITAIRIISQSVADGFREYFNLLWELNYESNKTKTERQPLAKTNPSKKQ